MEFCAGSKNSDGKKIPAIPKKDIKLMVKIWLIRSVKKGILFNLQMNTQYVAKRFNLDSFPVS
jgi:hypothetical protein